MNAEKALAALFAANAALVAIVGDNTYPGIVPQSTPFPFLRYSLVSEQRVRGAVSNPGLANALVQIDCFDSTYLKAKTLAAAVRTAIERKSGTYGTVTVQDVYFENETDGVDPELEQSYVIVEYRIYFKEA